MLPRVPRLTPDSSWEAKAITVVQSIKNKKVHTEMCVLESHTPCYIYNIQCTFSMVYVIVIVIVGITYMYTMLYVQCTMYI